MNWEVFAWVLLPFFSVSAIAGSLKLFNGGLSNTECLLLVLSWFTVAICAGILF